MNSHLPSKGDLLIVDDMPDNLHLLSEMLTEEGYDVRCVRSGSSALMGVHAQPPDLILLDINMPEMNGYEVCHQLKDDPQTRDIPIIFISALNEAIDKVKAFSVGGADYLTKPLQLEEVLARIENQLTVRRLQTELLKALDHERSLNRRIEAMATLEERNRIARDIHDSLGHLLVALNIQMETTLALWKDNPHQAYDCLTEAKQLGSDALQAVRESVAEIRCDPLEGNLDTAIQSLIQDFHRRTGLQPEFQINLTQPLSSGIDTVVYRIIQEGLTNICKYAKATVVKIGIQSDTEDLRLALEDNGIGFCMADRERCYGLLGMQERVDACGGQLEIVSAPGAGCRISVRIPR